MSLSLFTLPRKLVVAVSLVCAVLALCEASARAQVLDPQQRPTDCGGPMGAMSPDCQTAPSGVDSRPDYRPSPSAWQGSRSGITGMQPATSKQRDLTTAETPPLVPDADVPNEFQRFAASSVGSILPIFGSSLFQRVPTTFAPIDRVPVTADYVVGPGDELLLRVWGQVNLNLELVVDRAGAVYIPQAGNITVSGLQFRQLPAFLKSSLGRVYRNFDLTVNMGQLRSVQVFVIGQARRPGSYTVGSLSTLVNVLFASGGPTAQGSMRHIQLRRGDAVLSELDLYDLLLKGDKSKDARVLPGDVVFIPASGPQVAVAGSIRNAAVFELKDERTVADLLQLAGGVAPTADAKHVLLERINADHQRETLDLALDAVGRAVAIREADILSIRALSPHFEKTVTLRGNVANPGRFAWHQGMTIRDIIPNKESLITRAYWERKNGLGFQPVQAKPRPPAPPRTSTPDMQRMLDSDRPPDGSQAADPLLENRPPLDQFPDPRDRAIPDAGPNGKPLSPKEPRRTELATSAAEINWTYAVLERQDPKTLNAQLIPFNLGRLVLDSDQAQNYELLSGDVVTIFSTYDIHVPMMQQSRFVRLEGEFNAAGVYLARPGENLGQLIERAGGLTTQAYMYGAEFLRESTRREQQKRLDQFVKDMERELEQTATKRGSLTSTPDDVNALSTQLQSERKTVDQLKAMQATGRIVLNFDPGNPDAAKLMMLSLEDGDRFVVPSRPATVNVLGEVYNQNAFLHEGNLRVSDYLREAGGLKRNADKSHVFIIRADGSVLPKYSAGPFQKVFEAELLNPGDSIVVPEEILKVPFVRNLRQWTQVLADLGLGAAAINVLK